MSASILQLYAIFALFYLMSFVINRRLTLFLIAILLVYLILFLSLPPVNLGFKEAATAVAPKTLVI